ncbi:MULTISPECIES: oxidoreductase [unclassified Streptomyces]|uniref:oxidoreductase n=1 Tax=unclassified Streptomyces TaxID=2593676 RepID=UPI0004BFAA54|nr:MULTISPECIES: oxidoreductase [unclassified Streptomyces]
MWSTKDIPAQRGRVAVVTGANGGLGLATATALAAAGAHLVMAARDRPKADRACQRIRAAHPGASVEVVPLDLGSLESARSAAADIRTRHPRIDLLINNAGVMAVPESVTADGLETQFAVNHLGHWVLTAGLLPALVRTPGARVVTLTSSAQHFGRAVAPGGPYLGRPYTPWRAYDTSKLANRHFAQGLDRRFRAAGLSARALTAHPGFTDSDLFDTTRAAGAAGTRGRVLHSVTRAVGMDTERGVLSQLRAATDPHAEGGTLYGPLWVVTGPPVARRLIRPGADRAISRLWQVSRRLTGVDVDVAGALAESAGHA